MLQILTNLQYVLDFNVLRQISDLKSWWFIISSVIFNDHVS